MRGDCLISELEIIGKGNTATVYRLEDAKVLKLFHKGYPKEAVEKEFSNAKAVQVMDFPKPNAYEIVRCEGQLGIIYDRVEGISLLEWVTETQDVQQCAIYMADLHKAIFQNGTSGVPNYKEFLEHCLAKGLSANVGKQREVREMLARLKSGNTLCHGDFHPGNIFISDGRAVVIDFMNVCHGPYLYDIARTVFLVEYTPIPGNVPDREKLQQFRKDLADQYLMQMDVTRDHIEDYLSVIIAARLGECPDETGIQL